MHTYIYILSLYCRLQCIYFLSRILNNYIDLMAAYFLREWYFLSNKKAVVFSAFMHVLLKINIEMEFEYLHSFNLFCVSSFNIDIEYINGSILRKSKFGIREMHNMGLPLNMKMVNPWISEFDISINYIRIYVGIERVIVKIDFVKNIDWGHFFSKSKLK